ncbi:TcdA/TcdB catalytic glycosyltransferase domain-containing protein [Dyella sp.]|uniref:TcdA/TcdB catalytic glycosyltransferase domain-containing protein n=1 Tax=Dyella sp. TaxID=1869338 RepID=UPI002ED0B064
MGIWKQASSPEQQFNLWYDSDSMLAHKTMELLNNAADHYVQTHYSYLADSEKSRVLASYAVTLKRELQDAIQEARSRGGTGDDGRIQWLTEHLGQKTSDLQALKAHNLQTLSAFSETRHVTLRDIRTELTQHSLFKAVDWEMSYRGSLAGSSDMIRLMALDKMGGRYADVDLLPPLNIPGIDMAAMQPDEKFGVLQIILNANPGWMPHRDICDPARSKYIDKVTPANLAAIDLWLTSRPDISATFKVDDHLLSSPSGMRFGPVNGAASNAFLASHSDSPLLSLMASDISKAYDRIMAFDEYARLNDVDASHVDSAFQFITKRIEATGNVADFSYTLGLSEYFTDGYVSDSASTQKTTGPSLIVRTNARLKQPGGQVQANDAPAQPSQGIESFFHSETEEEIKSSWKKKSSNEPIWKASPAIYTGPAQHASSPASTHIVDILSGIASRRYLTAGDLSLANRIELAQWFPASDDMSTWSQAKRAANDTASMTQIREQYATLRQHGIDGHAPGRLSMRDRLKSLQAREASLTYLKANLPAEASFHPNLRAPVIGEESRRAHIGLFAAEAILGYDMPNFSSRADEGLEGLLANLKNDAQHQALLHLGREVQVNQKQPVSNAADILAVLDMSANQVIHIGSGDSLLSVSMRESRDGQRFYGFCDPTIGTVSDIADPGVFTKLLDQHIDTSFRKANQSIHVVKMMVTDQATKDLVQSNLSAMTQPSQRELLKAYDRRHGPLNLGDLAVSRLELHDHGAIIDGHIISVEGLHRAGDQWKDLLQFSGATVVNSQLNGHPSSRITDILLGLSDARERNPSPINLGSLSIDRTTLYNMNALVDGKPVRFDTRLSAKLANRITLDPLSVQQGIQRMGADEFAHVVARIAESRTSGKALFVEGRAACGGARSHCSLSRIDTGRLNALASTLADLSSRSHGTSDQANLLKYTLSDGRFITHTGNGLLALSLVSQIRSLIRNVEEGNTSAIALDSAGLATEITGELLEISSAAIAEAIKSTSFLSKFNTLRVGGLTRGIGIVGNLLSLPAEIGQAVISFQQAASSEGQQATDHAVSGSIATASAATSMATVAAMAAGIRGAGPIGFAVAAALQSASGLYSTIRTMNEIRKWAPLNASDEFNEIQKQFWGSFIGGVSISDHILDRIKVNKETSIGELVLKINLSRILQHSRGKFGLGIHGSLTSNAAGHVVDADDEIDPNGLNHHKNIVKQKSGDMSNVLWVTGGGNDRIRGYKERNNYFVLGDGSKTVTGGERENHFLNIGSGSYRFSSLGSKNFYQLTGKNSLVVIENGGAVSNELSLDDALSNLRVSSIGADLLIRHGVEGENYIILRNVYERKAGHWVPKQGTRLSLLTKDGFVVSPELPARRPLEDRAPATLVVLSLPRAEPKPELPGPPSFALDNLANALSRGLDELRKVAVSMGILAGENIPSGWPEHDTSPPSGPEAFVTPDSPYYRYRHKLTMDRLKPQDAGQMLGLDGQIVSMIRKLLS